MATKEKPDSNPQKKTGQRLKWSKLMCFALALAAEHQKKKPKSKNELVTVWASVLEVVNDVFLQEFEEFRKAYPNGLPNPNKLRTEFSDRYRGRHSSKWNLHREQCTPQEIQEMTRMADVVITTSQRLHDQRRPVHSPGPDAVRWIFYDTRPSAAPKGGRKRAKASEHESNEDEDEEDPVDDAPPYAAMFNQAPPPKKRARPSRNASRRDSTPADDEEDNITVARPVSDLGDDEDDDTARATHEDVPKETNTMGVEPISPQLGRRGRRARRPHELSGLDDQMDRNLALSSLSRFAEATGLDPSAHAGYVNNPLGSAIDFTTTTGESRSLESFSLVDQQLLDPVNNDGNFVLHGWHGERNDVIQEDRAWEAFSMPGETGGSHSQASGLDGNPIMYDHDFDVPYHKHADAMGDRLRRRAQQNAANADARTRQTTGYRPQSHRYAALQVPAHGVYYGDGHTEALGHTEAPPLYEWKKCKHALIRGYQAGQWNRTWDIIQSVPGIDFGVWDYRTEIVEKIVCSTDLRREEVLDAALEALCQDSTSSLKLQRLISYPTGCQRPLGTSDDGLDFILRSIAEQPRLMMIHFRVIDFSTDQPVCNINFEADNMIDVTGSKHEEFVNPEDPDDSLYSFTGEVRRVVLRNATTEQNQQVDLMVCDARICLSCNDAGVRPQFHFAYQRGQLPLVHHRDIMQPQEGDLIFCPREQGSVTGTIVAKEGDIHNVVFNGNKTCKAIMCDKAQCPDCLAEPWPPWPSNS